MATVERKDLREPVDWDEIGYLEVLVGCLNPLRGREGEVQLARVKYHGNR